MSTDRPSIISDRDAQAARLYREAIRLSRELQQAEAATAPDGACDAAVKFTARTPDPLLQPLEDASPWNQNTDAQQDCCSIS